MQNVQKKLKRIFLGNLPLCKAVQTWSSSWADKCAWIFLKQVELFMSDPTNNAPL